VKDLVDISGKCLGAHQCNTLLGYPTSMLR
jgi:hypothetical protein